MRPPGGAGLCLRRGLRRSITWPRPASQWVSAAENFECGWSGQRLWERVPETKGSRSSGRARPDSLAEPWNVKRRATAVAEAIAKVPWWTSLREAGLRASSGSPHPVPLSQEEAAGFSGVTQGHLDPCPPSLWVSLFWVRWPKAQAVASAWPGASLSSAPRPALCDALISSSVQWARNLVPRGTVWLKWCESKAFTVVKSQAQREGTQTGSYFLCGAMPFDVLFFCCFSYPGKAGIGQCPTARVMKELWWRSNILGSFEPRPLTRVLYRLRLPSALWLFSFLFSTTPPFKTISLDGNETSDRAYFFCNFKLIKCKNESFFT